MARIRTIKPEFWTDEQIMNCSTSARLLFIGMWNFCDDAGNHSASARTLKAEIFPSDDIDSSSIQLLLDELSSNGLIVLYAASGKEYWHVTGWAKHQKIDRPTYKYPSYEESLIEARRTLDESSPPEWKGMEGNGREWNGKEKNKAAALEVFKVASVKKFPKARPPVDNFFQSNSRPGEIAALLGGIGISNDSTLEKKCVAWADESKITNAILLEAVEKARQRKPEGSIPANFLQPFLDELLQPKPPKIPDWRSSDEATVAMGESLGMRGNGNENFASFRQRIDTELARRKNESMKA